MDHRILGRAAELLGAPVELVGVLSERDRASVARIRTGLADHPTAVVKWFTHPENARRSGGFGYAREYAGLTTLAATPVLLAADHDRAMMIMSDVGSGPGLAEALLADDPELAWRRGTEWATALGRLCATSQANADAFRAAIADVDPDTRSSGGLTSPNLVDQGLARLRTLGADTTGLDDELALFARLADPDPRDAVVTAGDFCPDNVIFTDQGPRFVDLEGSSVHHLALDAAYAWMPFGTCWCLADAPPEFVDHLAATFDRAARPELAATLDADDWPIMLQAAGAQIVLTMTEINLDAALRNPSYPVEPTTVRERLAARWRWAATTLTELPGLRRCFATATDWAEREWSPQWPSYPAFATTLSRSPR